MEKSTCWPLDYLPVYWISRANHPSTLFWIADLMQGAIACHGSDWWVFLPPPTTCHHHRGQDPSWWQDPSQHSLSPATGWSNKTKWRNGSDQSKRLAPPAGGTQYQGTIKPPGAAGDCLMVVYESFLTEGNFFPARFQSPFKSSQIKWSGTRRVCCLGSATWGHQQTHRIVDGGKALGTEPANDPGAWRCPRRADFNDENSPIVSSGSIWVGLETAGTFSLLLPERLSLKRVARKLFTAPLGKNTEMHLKGPLADLSLTAVPARASNVNAYWNVVWFQLPFSQQWSGKNKSLAGSNFWLIILWCR